MQTKLGNRSAGSLTKLSRVMCLGWDICRKWTHLENGPWIPECNSFNIYVWLNVVCKVSHLIKFPKRSQRRLLCEWVHLRSYWFLMNWESCSWLLVLSATCWDVELRVSTEHSPCWKGTLISESVIIHSTSHSLPKEPPLFVHLRYIPCHQFVVLLSKSNKALF